jgi:ketosteroid isomerase-like protein
MSERFPRPPHTEVVSEDLVGLQERLLRAVNEREVPEDLLAPGFSMQQSITSATDYAYHGTDGWRDWLNDMFEFFAGDGHCELVEVPLVGPDFVVATVRVVGHSALSNRHLEVTWTSVTRFHEGRAVSAAAFATPAEAIASIGALAE